MADVVESDSRRRVWTSPKKSSELTKERVEFSARSTDSGRLRELQETRRPPTGGAAGPCERENRRTDAAGPRRVRDRRRDHLADRKKSPRRPRLSSRRPRCSRTRSPRRARRIVAKGVAFDPTSHDAVEHGTRTAQDPEDRERRPGPVVDEICRPGYIWKGRVLRPAMVRVRG